MKLSYADLLVACPDLYVAASQPLTCRVQRLKTYPPAASWMLTRPRLPAMPTWVLLRVVADYTLSGVAHLLCCCSTLVRLSNNAASWCLAGAPLLFTLRARECDNCQLRLLLHCLLEALMKPTPHRPCYAGLCYAG